MLLHVCSVGGCPNCQRLHISVQTLDSGNLLLTVLLVQLERLVQQVQLVHSRKVHSHNPGNHPNHSQDSHTGRNRDSSLHSSRHNHGHDRDHGRYHYHTC